MSVWLDSSGNSNKFKQSYFRDFVDVSGEVLIRNGLSLKLYNNNVPTRVQFSINSNEFRIYNETDHTYYDISNTKLMYLRDLSENVQSKLNQVNALQSAMNLKADTSIVDASFVLVNSLIATKASTSIVDASFVSVNSVIATKASTSAVDASLNLKPDIAYLDASLNAKPSFSQVDAAVNLKANLSSPTFTGTPNAPTASYDNSSNQLATTGFVQGRISSIINSAPAALDTLNELAAALGNDANYAATVTNTLGQKANSADVNAELALKATIVAVDASLNLKSNITYVDTALIAKPSFSQVDASLNLKSNVIYVDASLNAKPSFSYVDAALNSKPSFSQVDASLNLKANLISPTFIGTPSAPTASYDNSSNQLATTGFVQGRISSIINGAPAALDTLYELAAALGNDANYASTVTNALTQKANSADVNAELALKATITSVDASLNLKSNLTYVDAALNAKPSFSQVDASLNLKPSFSLVDASLNLKPSFSQVDASLNTKPSFSQVDASLNLKSNVTYVDAALTAKPSFLQVDASLNAKPSFSQVDASLNLKSDVTSVDASLILKANLISPTFTGTPNAPTASYDNSSNQIATTGFVQGRISSIINSAPAALDTLNELAAALGNDANYAATVTNSLSQKANTTDVNSALALKATISSVDVSLNLKPSFSQIDISLNTKPSFSQVDISLNSKPSFSQVDASLNLKSDRTYVDTVLNAKPSFSQVDASMNLKANLASPTFTGIVTAAKLTSGDASFNGNVDISGVLSVTQTVNSVVKNTTINNYNVSVTNDLSLNGKLIVSSDVSLNSKLYVKGDASFNGRVDICGNFYANYPNNSIPSSAISNGVTLSYVDSSLNLKPSFAQVDASLNAMINSSQFDASLNLKSNVTYVDASLNLKSNVTYVDASLNLKANLASPTFTGTPNAPTAAYDNSSNQIATTGFVQGRISAIINSAPAALDTLNELAAALGNDANYAATVTNSLSQKANITDVNTSLALKPSFSQVDASLNLKPTFSQVDASLNAIINSSQIDASLNLKPSFSQVDASLNLKSAVTYVDSSLNLKANIASPTFTGTPNAPTASYDNSSNQIATTGFVQGRISAIINSAPAALDTLNELAAALGNDANYAATVTNLLSQKANITDVNSAVALKPTFSQVDVSLNMKPSFSQVDASLNLKAAVTYVDSALSLKPSFSHVDASLNLKSAVTYVDASLNLKPSFSQVDASLNLKPTFAQVDASLNAILNLSQVDASLNLKSSVTYVDSSLNIKAALSSPTFTGIPNAPTAAYDNSSNQIATTGFVQGRISSIINSAPAALDTLNELAAALGNDANYAATITNSLSQKANTTDVNAALALKPTFAQVDASLNLKPTSAQVDASLNLKPSFSQVDASLNLKPTSAQVDASLNLKPTFAQVDASLNAILNFSQVDASLNLKPSFVQVDASLNLKSNLTYVDASLNLKSNLTYVDASLNLKPRFAQVDASLNLKPSFVQVDASLNLKANLASPTFTGVVTAPKLTSGDASFNGNVDISGVLSVTQTVNSVVKNTTINNYNVAVTNDLSLNGKLIVSSDVSLNSKLYVKGDASFNGRVDICGNFYANYPANSIPSSAIIGGVSGGSTSGVDISSNQTISGVKTFTNGLNVGSILVSSVAGNPTFQRVQIGQDIEEGGGGYASFGQSVSMNSDGSIVAIGSNMTNSSVGRVCVYKKVGSTWTRIGQIIAGEAGGDQSGQSVSLSSDGYTVAIGAHNNDGNGTNSGHVRVYKYNGSTTWTKLGQDIDGENANDLSGYSVSISSDGSIVAIGAYYNAGVTGGSSGQVRVYQYNGSTTWTQIGQDIDGEASGDSSGWSVSLSSDGTIVAIGAVTNDGTASNAGQVRVYQYNGSSTWTKLGQDIDGEAASDQCGFSVSITADGTIVAIGSPWYNGTVGADCGRVRVYKYNGSTTWTQLGQNIDGEAPDDNSGKSVSLSADGTILAIGANLNDGTGNNAGHVRIYQYSGTTWTQLGSDINGEAADDHSGLSVSLSKDGAFVAIGAIYNDNVVGTDSGHVRVYQIRDLSVTKLLVNNAVDICGNLYAQYAAASIPASAINGISTTIQSALNLKATQSIVDASFTSVNSAIALKSTTSIVDASFTSVNSAIALKANLASPTFTGNVVASKMRVTSDASFNGRVDICGNFYAQYPASSIPSSAIIGGVGGGGGSSINLAADISVNGVTVGRGPGDSNFSTVLGLSALGRNTGGYMNVAVGCTTLFSNLTGNQNVAMNFSALYSNTSGSDNIAIGKQAITTNQTGSNNVGIGSLAIQGITSSNNTAVGHRSLVYSSTGSSNTAVGYLAGQNNSSGSFNTYIGYGADLPAFGATWSNSTAIGANAMITASNQIVLGTASERVVMLGKLSTSGDASFNGRVDICGNFYAKYPASSIPSSAIIGGVGGGSSINLTADISVNSLTVGRGSGNNSSNTALGVNALFAQGVDVNSNSTAIGYYALSANQAGSAVNNSAVGFEALKNNTIGNFNTALGSAALRNNTSGASNTALGASSLAANTTGNSNVGINGGLSANTSGSDNVAIGKQALTASQTGGNNIGIGTLVLQGITSSSNNTAIGHRALVYSSTGSSNTAYGYLAGGNNSTGSFNTYIGYGADVPAFGATWSNSTAIGANARITASNQITLGTATERVFMPGKLSTSGDASFNGRLDIGTNSVTPFATLAVSQLGSNLVGPGSGVNSTAINAAGTIVAVSSSGYSNYRGAVRVYQWSGTAWTQLGNDIISTTDGTQMGISVSLNSTGLILAAGGINRVRIYQYSNSTWSQLGADIIDAAGSSISISSDGMTFASGNPGAYINGGENTGRTRIYTYINSTWTQLGQDLLGEAASNRSGFSLALSADGTIVVIGAHYNDGTNSNGTIRYMSGHARIYKYANSTWTQLGQDIDGEISYDMSGWSVDISDDGTVVAIGAPRNTTGATTYNGHARVYKYANSTWTKLGQDIDGRAIWAQSGNAVSLSADGYTLAIGSSFAAGLGGETDRGYAVVYKYNGTTWSMVGSYIEGQAAGNQFGFALALNSDGTILSVGSPNNSGTGSVQLYKIQTPSSKIIVSDGLDICGNLYANSLQLSSSATFNGRVDICGNFYAQYPPNSIPASAIIGGVGSSSGSSGSSGSSTGANVTFTDNFALIKEAVVVDPASTLLRQF